MKTSVELSVQLEDSEFKDESWLEIDFDFKFRIGRGEAFYLLGEEVKCCTPSRT